jgi:hypothetical protein
MLKHGFGETGRGFAVFDLFFLTRVHGIVVHPYNFYQ